MPTRPRLQDLLRPYTVPHGPHLVRAGWPSAVYAIGDIHGCRDELERLEAAIAADAAAIEGEKWLVCLGDYIDRGPASAGVIEHLIRPPPTGFRRICLMGNHEYMLLDFLAHPRLDSLWLRNGGIETLASYGIDVDTLRMVDEDGRRAHVMHHIPNDHIDFVAGLYLTLSLPGVVFVHAGLRGAMPIDQQDEVDLLWIRDEFHEAPPVPGRFVVHGHTPDLAPVITPWRICVDTGAFATGMLTAVRLMPGKEPKFFDTRRTCK